MKNLIKKVPIPTAGVALGLAALGILLQPYSAIVHLTAGALSLLLLLLLGLKMVLFPRMIREDLKNPIFASVLATLFMTVMQLTTYLAPYAFVAAFTIWGAAIVAHVAFIMWFTAAFIFRFDLKQVFPTYFIAYVGIIVVTLTSPTFGMQDLGFIVFWAGLAFFAVLLVLVTVRYIKHEVPESAKPLLCIFAAPASLSLAAYLAIANEPILELVIVATAVAQALLVLVLTQLPRLLRIRFYPSYAAMTFPFVVSAIALANATAYFQTLGFDETLMVVLQGATIAETVFATVMVLYVFAHYLRFFFSREKARQTQTQAQPQPQAQTQAQTAKTSL